MSRKEELQKFILRRLLFHGRTTRPELVGLTGIRAATVFEAVDALKRSGMIAEPDRRGKKTGRRAPELECNRDHAVFIGVELQTSGVVGTAVDSCGDILEKYETRIAAPRRELEDTRDEIIHCVQTLRQRLGDRRQLVRGIGFADPGPADAASGLSLRAPDVPGWEDHETGKWLAGETGVPVGVWPGQMIRTRMEYLSRLPDAPESLFLLGTGDHIGGGFIKNGRLFVGANHRGMEIGHVIVDPDGPVCFCGNRGCLEATAGKAGILELVRRALRGGVNTELEEHDLSLGRFVECAYRDKAARMIADEVSKNIGKALATVVALLNPAVIVLSGPLVGLGDLLTEAIRRELNLRCFAGAVAELELELSSLEDCDTARGAAMMMRDRIFGIDDPIR